MTNKVVESILTDSQKMKYQRRLRSYLKDYAYRNDLQDKDVAEQIDISPQKFSYMKSDKKPYGKFISSLDYLAKFGQLNQISILEFVMYLEGQDDDSSSKRIYHWQKTMISAFESINSTMRGHFVDLCKKSTRDGKKKLEVLIDVVNILQKKEVVAIESVRDMLKIME